MKLRAIFWLVFFTIACSTSSSCQAVKYGHPGTKVEKEIIGKIYDKNGVKFSYPKDWQIVEDKISETGGILIQVVDVPFCLVNIKVYSSELQMDLRREAENVDKKMQRSVEKPFGDRTSSINRNFRGQNREGIRLRSSFSTSYVTLPDTTDFFIIEGQKSKALIIISAGDADWKVADKEFQFILDSLKFD
jgi:hypothetical protein